MATKPAAEPRRKVAAPAEVRIPTGLSHVEGVLTLPESPSGLVVFAGGSGISWLSPCNTFVARELQQAGMGTLLMDLLTPEQESAPQARIDISLLGRRLAEVTAWTRARLSTRELPLGYFGASTGAAAAVVAGAAENCPVKAIVSLGGRPALAGTALGYVRAPTLLLVGGNDIDVVDLNDEALHAMRCLRKLVLVPGATHLFEEPGTLEEVARLTAEWFERWLK